jgi:type I restriction enzyme R subunit
MIDDKNTTRNRVAYLKLDERNHVEKPLLDHLAGLGWEIIDFDSKQRPGDSFRETFAEVVMLRVLRKQLNAINLFLSTNQPELWDKRCEARQ